VLWRNGGKYPAWGTSPEWDDVLRDLAVMADCERYHCLPSQLDGEDYHELQRHRAIEAAEARYRAENQKSQARAAARKRR
jgi:hypothetical protein